MGEVILPPKLVEIVLSLIIEVLLVRWCILEEDEISPWRSKLRSDEVSDMFPTTCTWSVPCKKTKLKSSGPNILCMSISCAQGDPLVLHCCFLKHYHCWCICVCLMMLLWRMMHVLYVICVMCCCDWWTVIRWSVCLLFYTSLHCVLFCCTRCNTDLFYLCPFLETQIYKP